MLSPARRLALAATLALVVLGSAGAGPAGAGEYRVNVCRNADGSVAPTDGWQLAVSDDFVAQDIADNSCANGGQIDLELRSGSPHGRLSGSTYSGAAISFYAVPPPATGWREADVWSAYGSNPAGMGSEQISGSIAGAPSATCTWPGCQTRGNLSGPPFNPINRTTVPIADASGPLAVTIACSSAPLACPSVSGNAYAQLRVWRLLVTLAENSAPAFSAQPALPVRAEGRLSVPISATDGGSGLRTAQLVLDGVAAGVPRLVDAADARCAGRSDGTFGQLVPCRLSISAAPVTLDIANVSSGMHRVSVRIGDAAGNVTDSVSRSVMIDKVVALSTIPLDNPLRGRGHVRNGSGSAVSGMIAAGLRPRRRGKLRATMTLRRGQHARLAGRLVGANGKPVGGALLSVTCSRPGAEPHRFTVRTRADGRYSRALRWGPSRRLVVSWYPFGDSTRALRSRGVRLQGAASVTLGVSPLQPRNGRPLVFAGRVTGAPKGARVTIQVRDGRFWRTFLLPAVNKQGHYRGRRTLQRSAGLSYCFRARVPSQPKFAYAAGSSRSVCRRVR